MSQVSNKTSIYLMSTFLLFSVLTPNLSPNRFLSVCSFINYLNQNSQNLLRDAVMYTIGYNGVQIKKKKFETRGPKFQSFNIVKCTVYSVNFVCTVYGWKMLAALNLLDKY